MGYQDAFNAFVADSYSATAGGAPEGTAEVRRRPARGARDRRSAGVGGIRILGGGRRMSENTAAEQTAAPILTASGLSKSFFGVTVLHDVGIELLSVWQVRRCSPCQRRYP